MPTTVQASTFAELLASRAQSTPDRTAFVFLRDGETDEEVVTYAELDRRCQAIAAHLREQLPAGSRALLLYPPGMDYVSAVFGTFYARVIGVSAVPPQPKRLHRTLPRLLAIAADADVAAVMTTPQIHDAAEALRGGDQALARAEWVTPGFAELDADWSLEPSDRSEVAFLQYTSGSTAAPRGVMLTHANLLANSEFIQGRFGLSEESTTFIWLPPYHDMGLIGGLIQAVYSGYPCVLTSPISVIKRPARWLEGIARHRATVSGGPNFAYDMCVNKVLEEECEGLDLSSWEVAFNGAEPVRATTIDEFSARFGPNGFRRSAFLPCYGLAEATLMVTGTTVEEGPTTRELDADRLEQGWAAEPGPGARVARLVSSGAPSPDHDLAIVDPATLRRAAPDQVGEVWVAGPSVAGGYWRREAESGEQFAARIAGDDGGPEFLRTGDLGVVLDGELFVVGRLKDLIIVNGRNCVPDDIEALAESVDPLLRPHCSAAFAVTEDEGHEQVPVYVVAEVNPEDADWQELIARVRSRLAEEVEVHAHAIVLCAPGSVPKTTSGKIQRRLCAKMLAEGELEVVADWRLGGRS